MPETKLMPRWRLDSLLPPSIMEDLEATAFELVRAVLIRSTYIPGVRHRLGWCGIHEVVAPGSRPGSIAAKINDRPGIFALDPIEDNQGRGSRFSLTHLFEKKERNCDFCSYFMAPRKKIIIKTAY